MKQSKVQQKIAKGQQEMYSQCSYQMAPTVAFENNRKGNYVIQYPQIIPQPDQMMAQFPNLVPQIDVTGKFKISSIMFANWLHVVFFYKNQ